MSAVRHRAPGIGSIQVRPEAGAEEAAAIVAAIHRHRRAQAGPPVVSASPWQEAARQESLRVLAEPLPRPDGWRWAARAGSRR